MMKKRIIKCLPFLQPYFFFLFFCQGFPVDIKGCIKSPDNIKHMGKQLPNLRGCYFQNFSGDRNPTALGLKI